MPLYDYFCPTNQLTVEVRHAMKDEIRTWGELVSAAGIEAGDTPLESEVRRKITGGSVMTASTPEVSRPKGGCGPACACHAHSA